MNKRLEISCVLAAGTGVGSALVTWISGNTLSAWMALWLMGFIVCQLSYEVLFKRVKR